MKISSVLVRGIHRIRVIPLEVLGSYLLTGLVLASGMLFVFAYLAVDVFNNETIRSDQLIIGFLGKFRTPTMTALMESVTFFGSAPVVITIGFFTWLFVRRRKSWEANLVLISLAGSFILNRVLKLAFHRSRPDLFPIVYEPGYSFPSAHAMVSFAFYGMLIYLVWTSLRPGPVRCLVGIVLALLVFAIGVSRIYLGVHYPSDVIAGFAAGGLWLIGCVLGLHAIRSYRGVN